MHSLLRMHSSSTFLQLRADGSSALAESAVMKVFQSYIQLEVKQDYAAIYGLLSSRFKRELEKSIQVTSANGYSRARLSSETQWSEFRIISLVRIRGGRKFTVEAKAEGSGTIDNVKSTYYLIREHGTWKIDRWDY